MHTQKHSGMSRISNQLIEEVVKYITTGTPGKVAANAAGIRDSEYLLWTREGSSPHHLDNCPDCDFAQFYLAILKAEAMSEAKATACIMRAIVDGDWQAAAWWLERRFQRWAGPQHSNFSSEPKPVSIEEIEAKLEQIRKQRGLVD